MKIYLAFPSAGGTRLLNGFQRKGRYYIAFDRASKPSVNRIVFGSKKWLKCSKTVQRTLENALECYIRRF